MIDKTANDPLDENYLRQWIGSQQSIEETLSAEPIERMRATLDLEAKTFKRGDPIPPLWHWAYFLEPVRARELGLDGHAALGDFMPPVPLTRRMWAGGRFKFIGPIRVGERARKQSTVHDVKFKQGRSGLLCFVEVEHAIYVDDELRFSETHDIVYRAAKQPGEQNPAPPKAPVDAQWSRRVEPNPTLLFRYSALTFNGHRIHYDLDFCREVEGYPGLVFHGPLTATLLLELAIEHNPGRSIRAYEFRAIRPLFDNTAFSLNGCLQDGKAEMWASNADGLLAMQSTVSFCDE